MKLLIDESLPRRLKRLFPGHIALTVVDCGWAAKPDRTLLSLAEREFDVFVTADQSLAFQQDARRYDLAVVVLAARSNRLDDLVPLIPRTLHALRVARPGTLRRIEG